MLETSIYNFVLYEIQYHNKNYTLQEKTNKYQNFLPQKEKNIRIVKISETIKTMQKKSKKRSVNRKLLVCCTGNCFYKS